MVKPPTPLAGLLLLLVPVPVPVLAPEARGLVEVGEPTALVLMGGSY
jgi:hypothetical protein